MMNQDLTTTRLAITTPELITFHYQVAGLASRTLAWLIDFAILLTVKIGLVIALVKFGSYGMAVLFAMLLLVDFGYYSWCEWRYHGQTPGKKLMGIHVVCVSGASLQAGDVLLRNLMRVVDSLPMFMVTGVICAAVDPYRRRLGDLAAGTAVVRVSQSQLPAEMFNTGSRSNTYAADAAMRQRILARVTREERDLLIDLAMRRDHLEALSRQEVFRQAMSYFSRRFNLPELDYLTDEQAVLNVALVVQQQRGLGRN